MKLMSGGRVKIGRAAAILAALMLVGAGTAQNAPVAGGSASAAAEPAIAGGPATFRRLNEGQYKRSITDIFGAGITVPGRFEPSLREHGMLAIGEGKVAVSPSGIEQYELRSREIAAQVLSEARRKTNPVCGPAAPQTFDRACATEFLGKYGRLLYRRPLSQAELGAVVQLASSATEQSQNFYKGLEAGLSRLLSSPNFIFRVERAEADPAGGLRLDDHSLATRISFLLWDAPPDAQLLDAAASGALRQPAGLAQEVDRMIASPRFEAGVRAFFSDMFAYDQFNGLTKDQSIYPKFSSALAKDAQEQSLRTIVDLLVTTRGDYRDLFTTKKTFLNRNLGSLYKVALDEGGIDGWIPYSFAADDPREGILLLGAFLMLDPTHEGRSSPTIRGKTIREQFLCQQVPLPPANVNFTLVQDVNDKARPTARMRLSEHSRDPACSGCHMITDPIGLAMENFDGLGNFRTTENGVKIDTSGDIDGQAYKNATEMTRLLRNNPAIPACAVQRVYEYGVGRQTGEAEAAWLSWANDRFAANRYGFPALMRVIATSNAFRTVSADRPAAAPAVKTSMK